MVPGPWWYAESQASGPLSGGGPWTDFPSLTSIPGDGFLCRPRVPGAS